MALIAKNYDLSIARAVNDVYIKIFNIALNSYNTQVLMEVQVWLNKEARVAAKEWETAKTLYDQETDKENHPNYSNEEWEALLKKINYRIVPVHTYQHGCRIEDLNTAALTTLDKDSLLVVAYDYMKVNVHPESFLYEDA